MIDANIVTPDDPTLSAAMEALSLESADAAPAPVIPAAPAKDSATSEPPAPVQVDTTASTPKTEPAGDTPATTDSTVKPTDDKRSKYAKSLERLDKTWENVNKEKADLQKAKDDLEKSRQQIESERQAIEAERQKVSQPKISAEQYDDFARNCERRAELLEKEGKYVDADEERTKAKLATKAAAEVRANPPKPDGSAQQAQFQAEQKVWWGKAAQEFPDVVKKDSPAAQALAGLVKTEPAVLASPKGLYYAARLVTAESNLAVAKSDAARVPLMEKELVAARAKIKELEGKLTIPLDASAGAFTAEPGEKTMEQKEEELRSEALALGNWQ